MKSCCYLPALIFYFVIHALDTRAQQCEWLSGGGNRNDPTRCYHVSAQLQQLSGKQFRLQTSHFVKIISSDDKMYRAITVDRSTDLSPDVLQWGIYVIHNLTQQRGSKIVLY